VLMFLPKLLPLITKISFLKLYKTKQKNKNYLKNFKI
jgi:hypothetical protein